ncbi:bacteriocin [Acetobacter aceti]|uniref:Bacteriocin n=1 Tax=Acetobacter aceti TaxID=435 RepID=A0A6S6PFR4_ACEAC|nr:bacteriocin [Acetobacter aceti]BCI65451.1 hypothetical protein AAJCM20276_00750 [Acetobacter aceti]
MKTLSAEEMNEISGGGLLGGLGNALISVANGINTLQDQTNVFGSLLHNVGLGPVTGVVDSIIQDGTDAISSAGYLLGGTESRVSHLSNTAATGQYGFSFLGFSL